MMSNFSVYDVRVEHRLQRDCLGIHDTTPRISWKVSGAREHFRQAAYEILMTDLDTTENKRGIEAVQVKSSNSLLVPWPFQKKLQSRQRISLKVRIWNSDDQTSSWSEECILEVGLLDRDDWRCQRIYNRTAINVISPGPEQLFRKDFQVADGVHRARLYITTQGVYQAEINGKVVGDHVLAPGWTNPDNKLNYQTFDVTGHFLPSTAGNCIAVRVAEGWFHGRLGFGENRRNHWGGHAAVLAQLEIFYQDGSRDTIATDGSWLTTTGPTRLAELYDGEKYDARLEISGWSMPSSVDLSSTTHWRKVNVLTPLDPAIALVPNDGEPVRATAFLKPVKRMQTPTGRTILDFGHNIVGYIRMKNIRGSAGHKISIYHAEVLEKEELARRPLRSCKALDEYTLKESPHEQERQPRFTYHGFRFIQIDGWPEEADDILQSIVAVFCHSDMEPTGSFSCSDPLLNQLHENAVRSLRGNFFYLPTDCPQRDERLGWTGDIALFAPTALLAYNCTGVLKNWMDDVVYEQKQRGGIPTCVTPDVFAGMKFWGSKCPIAIWNDVVVLVPWAVYQETGDVKILAAGYESMESWLSSIPRNRARGSILWDPECFQFGDWLDPAAPAEEPTKALTDSTLVADAYLVNSLRIVSQTASLLQKQGDASKYQQQALQAHRDFVEEYITAMGRITADSQTAYALAICFNLFPSASQRAHAGALLATIVRKNNFRLATGFAGTPYICEALVLTGHAQIAYSMLLNRACPSWLYPITMGATTMWERWDSMLPDGSINPGEMTSFNHYAFGAVVRFLYERLAGLSMREPGWRKAKVEPVLCPAIRSARAEHLTPFGMISCGWEVENGVMEVEIVVPPGVTLEVILPIEGGDGVKTVGAGRWRFSGEVKPLPDWPVKGLGGLPWLDD